MRLSDPASLAWGGGWRALEAEGLSVARSSQVLDIAELNALFFIIIIIFLSKNNIIARI